MTTSVSGAPSGSGALAANAFKGTYATQAVALTARFGRLLGGVAWL